ncbi:nucleotide exchange factor GrpE [Corynebacterium uropygiale]|uniref:Protein GrpE n=1 Tax=Corynebacterium uropygiale TaxID=1775911 RepID=A0A9X1QT51_9CORY|nr:nucleotide exchange factor GrpE [Corynebacterium uropygiale]
MTQPHEMPDNPGDPEVTDPEVIPGEEDTTSAEVIEDAEVVEPEPELDGVEPVDAQAEAEAAADTEAALAADLQAQLDERTDDLKRVSAEYANYRRRTDRERTSIAEGARAGLIAKFLTIMDDLDLAEQHGDLEEGPLKAFADKFRGVLAAEKLEPFGAEGDEFDPEIHEAVQDLSSGDDKALGTVLRKGYRVGDQMVRSAMVIIADPVDTTEEEE